MTSYESHHLFIAPLYLEKRADSRRKDPEARIGQLQRAVLEGSRFKLKERRFSAATPQDYGNYQYFFEDVRKSVFWRAGQTEQDDGALAFRLNVTDAPYGGAAVEPIAEIALRFFEAVGGRLRVSEEIRLELLDVDITLYQFDVGHVSFLCRFRMDQETPGADRRFHEQVLLINDRMRRLFLPWLAEGVGLIPSDDLEGRKAAQVAGGGPYHEIRLMIHEAYGNFAPQCPGVLVEDYGAGLRFETMDLEAPNRPILLESVLGQMDQRELGWSFELLDDNRMFTLAHIRTRSMTAFLDQPEWGSVEALKGNANWHRLMTVDGVQATTATSNAALRQQAVAEGTYARWLDSASPDQSTLFGVTRHSFIMLGSSQNPYFTGHLTGHFLHQYSEMVRLTLGQLAAVHRFGRDIYTLSGSVMSPRRKIRSHGLDEGVFREVTAFRQSFNDYINRLSFREVSPQIQGSELYRLVQRRLGIQDHLAQLREEISQLFSHVEMLQRQSQEKSIHQLTQTSIVLGVLAVVAGIYGANFIAMEGGRMTVDTQALGLFALIVAVALTAASGMTLVSGGLFALGDALRKLVRLD